jgi:parallel beta-helix repeat protein
MTTLVLVSMLPCAALLAAEKSDEEKAAMSLYKKGKDHFDAGDWTAASELFAKSITVYTTPYAKIYRAVSLANLSRCTEARIEIDRFPMEMVAEKARDKALDMIGRVKDKCPLVLSSSRGAAAPVAPVPVAPVQAAPVQSAPSTARIEAAPATPRVQQSEPSSVDKSRRKPNGDTRAIVVSPDGKGDFTSLHDAVARAKPGSVIHLADGMHRLVKPLDITIAINLMGDGKGSTSIVGDSEDYVIRFVGKGPFLLHDLSVEHQGGRWARVILVDGGEIDFRGLRVSGGFRDDASKRGGEGLSMQGDTSGTVTGCEFVGNALHGVKLAGTARPTLDGNVSNSNGKGGIVWLEESGGAARANTCASNGQYGMAVLNNAKPGLSGNICSGNRRGGLFLDNQDLEGISNNRCDIYRVR